MGNLYVIKDMGRGFDGLIVEAHGPTGDDLYGIARIVNRNHVFGDRNLSFPVPPGCLYIDGFCLEPFQEEFQEFDSKNPNGKYLCESRHRRHDLEVVMVEYERCVTVSVLEHERDVEPGRPAREVIRTRYTENFLTDRDVIKETVHDAVKAGDLDDLIFSLTAIKDAHRAMGG